MQQRPLQRHIDQGILLDKVLYHQRVFEHELIIEIVQIHTSQGTYLLLAVCKCIPVQKHLLSRSIVIEAVSCKRPQRVMQLTAVLIVILSQYRQCRVAVKANVVVLRVIPYQVIQGNFLYKWISPGISSLPDISNALIACA